MKSYVFFSIYSFILNYHKKLISAIIDTHECISKQLLRNPTEFHIERKMFSNILFNSHAGVLFILLLHD